MCLAALSVEDIEDIYLFGTMITGILLIILETKMDRECNLQNWNAFTRPKDKTILSFSGSPTQWPWQGCCWNLPRESNAVRHFCFLPPPYRHSDIAPPRPLASVRFEPPACQAGLTSAGLVAAGPDGCLLGRINFPCGYVVCLWCMCFCVAEVFFLFSHCTPQGA